MHGIPSKMHIQKYDEDDGFFYFCGKILNQNLFDLLLKICY